MIELLIYHLHIVGALYAFTKNWQTRSFKDGILAVIIILLFFAIGWALTGSIAHNLMPDFMKAPFFTADTLSLVLLVIPESIFFYFFFIRDKLPTEEKNS